MAPREVMICLRFNSVHLPMPYMGLGSICFGHILVWVQYGSDITFRVQHGLAIYGFWVQCVSAMNVWDSI